MDVNIEIAEIRQQLKNIAFKLQMIEKVSNSKKPLNLPKKKNPPTIASTAKTIIKDIPEDSKCSKNSLENIFGQYWLSRIGVIIFVIGIGFLINYTFQSFGAILKIILGFALAIVFFIWGGYLEKKPDFKKISWGISGGAWGLFYLTVYAMYYFDATKVISSIAIETFLLMLVSVIAILYNLKYKSWVVTTMTYFLAFATTNLGGFNQFSIIYFLLLVLSVVILSCRLNWYLFLLLGTVGSYLTYIGFDYSLQMFMDGLILHFGDIHISHFNLMFSLLTVTWFLYSMATHWMKLESENEIKMNVVVLSLNAFMYMVLGLQYIVGIENQFSFNARGWFLLFLGVAYLLKNITHYSLKRGQLYSVTNAISAFIFGFWFLTEFPNWSITLCWAFEMMILFFLGMRYRSATYRLLGAGFGMMAFFRFFIYDFNKKIDIFHGTYDFMISHNNFVGIGMALLFCVLGILSQPKNEKNIYIVKDEKVVYEWLFPCLSVIIFLALANSIVIALWVSALWTTVAVFMFSIGFIFNNKAFRIVSFCVIFFVLLRIISYDISGLTTIYKIVTFIGLGIILMCISLIYSKFLKS